MNPENYINSENPLIQYFAKCWVEEKEKNKVANERIKELEERLGKQ